MAPATAPLLRSSLRAYSALLGALPAWLRRARREEMVELFTDLYRDAYARRGLLGLAGHWTRSLRGLATASVRSRPATTMPPSPRGDAMIHTILHELRLALRMLAGSPGFAAVTVTTLALGIAATTAIFSLVYGVAIRPLPFPDPHRLVFVDHGAPGLGFENGIGMSPGLYEQYTRKARTLESIGYWRQNEVTLTGDGAPERVAAGSATAGLFQSLGVQPALGRLFSESDDAPDSERSVVLSHALWQRRYGGDPEIVGRSIEVSGGAIQVIGVLPAGFEFDRQALWLDNNWDFLRLFGGFSGFSVARIAAGVELADVARDLDTQIGAFDGEYPGVDVKRLLVEAKVRANPLPLADHIVGGVRETLWILLGTASFVLLTACANVANLFLVRTEARQREIAVRMVLGAGRAGVARLFLSESLLLAAIGGTLGTAAAVAGIRLLVASAPPGIPRLGEVRIDATVLAVTALITLAAGVAFGLVPAWRRVGTLSDALRDGGRSASVGYSRARARQALVVSQVALALVLLAGAGLMARSFVQLRGVDPGFDPEDLLTFELSLPEASYPEDVDAVGFHTALLERIQALPGVLSAGAAREAPFGGLSAGELMVVEGVTLPEGQLPPVLWANRATEGYFETVGMRLIRGRLLDRRDLDERTNALVINEAAARVFFADEDPIGRRVSFNPNDEDAWMMVVGLVGDAKAQSLSEDTASMGFISMLGGTYDMAHRMSYVVRTAVPPLSLVEPVRAAVGEADANLPLIRLRTMGDVLQEVNAPAAFTTTLLAIAAAVSLVLGCVGVYGVVAYVVRQRTGEIGVRMALGAQAGDVLRMVVAQGAALAGLGILIGAAVAALLVRSIESVLFRVDPFDPLTHLGVAAVLFAVILIATWLPAHRASRIDPLAALKE